MSFSYSKFSSSNNNNNNNDFGDQVVVPELQIGMGYSDNTQMATSKFCVDTSDIVLHGKPESSIGFSSSMNFDQIQSDLGVDVSAYVSVDRFSASIACDYAKSIQNNGYSLSYSFVFNVQLPSQVLHINQFGPGALSSFGVGVFSEANSTGGVNKFDDICGNKFVIQENSGAKLYTTLNVEFDSKYDMNKFKIGFKGNIADLADAVLKINDYSASHSISGSIKLSAIQVGGDVMQLTQVFGSSPDNNVLKCQFNAADIGNCKNVVNDIINYAKNNFAFQIKYNSTSGQITGTPASTGVVFNSYKSIGIDNYHMGVGVNVTAIRNFFGKLDSDLNLLSVKLDKLLYNGVISGFTDSADPTAIQLWSAKWFWNPEYISMNDKVQLRASYEAINNIVEVLHSQYTGPIQCYKSPYLCDQVNQTISNVLSQNPIDYNVVAKFDNAYQFSSNCNGVDFGFRILFPISGNDFIEKTHYISNVTSTNVTNVDVVNYFNIQISSIKKESGQEIYSAALSVNGQSCFTGMDQKNPGDIVPYFHSDDITSNSNDNCLKALCPVEIQQNSAVGVTFFVIDSPI